MSTKGNQESNFLIAFLTHYDGLIKCKFVGHKVNYVQNSFFSIKIFESLISTSGEGERTVSLDNLIKDFTPYLLYHLLVIH